MEYANQTAAGSVHCCLGPRILVGAGAMFVLEYEACVFWSTRQMRSGTRGRCVQEHKLCVFQNTRHVCSGTWGMCVLEHEACVF